MVRLTAPKANDEACSRNRRRAMRVVVSSGAAPHCEASQCEVRQVVGKIGSIIRTDSQEGEGGWSVNSGAIYFGAVS